MTDYLERVSELEEHFCKVGKDCVLLAKSEDVLKGLLIASIWGSDEYKTLPKRSQSYVAGFVRGAAEMCSLEVKPVLTTPVVDLPPREILDLQPAAQWHKHPNGGGWVSDSAYVEGTASVSSRAAVFGNARVLDRVRVYGYSRIGENAEVFGAAHIHGHAVLRGNCRVFDAAKVLGEAIIGGTVEIGGTSVVRGSVRLEGSDVIIDEHITDPRAQHSDVRELRPKKRTSVRPAASR